MVCLYQIVALSIVGMLVWTVQGCSSLMPQSQFRALLPHLPSPHTALPHRSLYQQKKNAIQVEMCVIPQLYLIRWQGKKDTTYYLLTSRRGILPSACTVAAGAIAFWDGSGKPMSLEQTNELRLLRPNAALLGLLCLADTVVTEEKMRKVNWSYMPNNIDFEIIYGSEKYAIKGRSLQELLGNMMQDAWSQAPRQIVPVELHCEAKVEQNLKQAASRQLQYSSAPSQHRNTRPGSGGCKAEIQTQEPGHSILPEGNKTNMKTNMLKPKSTAPNPSPRVPVLPDTSTVQNVVPQLEEKGIDCGISTGGQPKNRQALLESIQGGVQLKSTENKHPAQAPLSNAEDPLQHCLMSRRNGIDPQIDYDSDSYSEEEEEEGENEEENEEKREGIISLPPQNPKGNAKNLGTVASSLPSEAHSEVHKDLLCQIRNGTTLTRIQSVQVEQPGNDNSATNLKYIIPFIARDSNSDTITRNGTEVADSEWD